MDAKLICLKDELFFEFVDEVVKRVAPSVQRDKWVSGEEAMRLLNIKSKTSLQRYRDEGRIRFTQPDKRVILYDRDSIDAFLESHAQDTY